MSGTAYFLAVPAPMDFTDRAACRGRTELFYCNDGGHATEAKKICAACPVLAECRAHAIPNEHYGVWGGLSESERNRLRRGTRVLRTCNGCGCEFPTPSARQRQCCSDACRETARVEAWKAYNAKVRERRAAS